MCSHSWQSHTWIIEAEEWLAWIYRLITAIFQPRKCQNWFLNMTHSPPPTRGGSRSWRHHWRHHIMTVGGKQCLLCAIYISLLNAVISDLLNSIILQHLINFRQGSRIRSVCILFSERYVRTLTYSILAYVNKNRIRKQTMITEATNWFFATVLINLLFDCVVQNGQFN